MPKKIRVAKANKKKPLGGTSAPKPLITKHKSNSSSNPNRVIKGKKPHSCRDKATIKRLGMYNEKPNEEARSKRPDKPANVEPDRRWFGNTRTISQTELEAFRQEVREATNDPYSVLINRTKLPMSLISQPTDTLKRPPVLDIESYQDVFGPKAKRKRPKIRVDSLENLMQTASSKQETYEEEKDPNIEKAPEDKDLVRDKRLEAGQSKRIWQELYKVLDSSDVIVQVLDVRNPLGTRCPHVEKQIAKKPNRHLVFVLNKCDLVPTWVSTAWVKYLSQEYPTVAFKASVTNPFGKAAVISLLKQFDKLHRDKKSISIGFIGYPNVGKSSIINTLRKKDVCKVAPIPGETKVWQYITLTTRIYLIDCPGIVYDTNDSDSDLVLKGVVRPEKLEDPSLYIESILQKVPKETISGIYGVKDWTDTEDFIGQLAKMSGRLLKGGDPDYKTIAKNILHDWQRGKVPYFEMPPN